MLLVGLKTYNNLISKGRPLDKNNVMFVAGLACFFMILFLRLSKLLLLSFSSIYFYSNKFYLIVCYMIFIN